MPENWKWKISLIFQKEKKLKLGGNETKPQKTLLDQPVRIAGEVYSQLPFREYGNFSKYNTILWYPCGQDSFVTITKDDEYCHCPYCHWAAAEHLSCLSFTC